MNNFQLKVILTSISAVLFSLILILLALVLPTGDSKNGMVEKDVPETEFQKMSKGMREGFKK